jgi:hypothetical protein
MGLRESREGSLGDLVFRDGCTAHQAEMILTARKLILIALWILALVLVFMALGCQSQPAAVTGGSMTRGTESASTPTFDPVAARPAKVEYHETRREQTQPA